MSFRIIPGPPTNPAQKEEMLSELQLRLHTARHEEIKDILHDILELMKES